MEGLELHKVTEEKSGEIVSKTYTNPETGKFIEGNPGGGRPKDTPLKKAAKQLIIEYKEALAEALPMLSPVLIKQAMKGDVGAIRELHDRAMGKPPQHTTFDGEIRTPKPIDDVRQNTGLQENKDLNETS